MEVAVGDWVQAQDRRGHWYDARIVAERGTGESREVKVHYHRWKSRHDEWLAASGPRVLGEDADLPARPSYRWTAKPGKVHGADDQYIAEKLLKVRGEGTVREFLVRWKGYTKDDDSWEPEEHIEQSLMMSPRRSSAALSFATCSRARLAAFAAACFVFFFCVDLFVPKIGLTSFFWRFLRPLVFISARGSSPCASSSSSSSNSSSASRSMSSTSMSSNVESYSECSSSGMSV